MNGIAFRLSIVCYDRLFSRKCSLYRFKRSDYFSKYHIEFFFPFLSICLMFLHLRIDCLIIENLETIEADRNFSISVHFSRLLGFFYGASPTTELLSLDTGEFIVAAQR